MRIIYFLWALVFVLSSCKEKPSTSIVLKNPINEERVDEMLRLSRMELRAVGDELLPVVKKADGTYIPCQVDDRIRMVYGMSWLCIYLGRVMKR